MANLMGHGERKLVQHIKDKVREHGGSLMLDDSAPLPSPPPGTQLWMTTDPCPFPNLTARLGMGGYYEIGWLCVAKSLSDLAAVGAKPLGVTVSVDLVPDTPLQEFDEFFNGVIECAVAHGTSLIGGNIKEIKSRKRLSDSPQADRLIEGTAVSAAVGFTSSSGSLLRGPVGLDHVLYVIERGDLGGFWAGVAAHQQKRFCGNVSPQVIASVVEMTCRPKAKVAAAEVLSKSVRPAFCMDNSDGLLASVLELLSASEDSLDCVISLKESDFPDGVREVASACRNPSRGYFTDVRNWALGWGTCQLLCASDDEGFALAQRALAVIGCEPVAVGRTQAGSGRILVEDESGQHAFDASAFIKCEQFLPHSFWALGPEAYAEIMLRFRLRDLSGSFDDMKHRLEEYHGRELR